MLCLVNFLLDIHRRRQKDFSVKRENNRDSFKDTGNLLTTSSLLEIVKFAKLPHKRNQETINP
jgi:hypothetical protein